MTSKGNPRYKALPSRVMKPRDLIQGAWSMGLCGLWKGAEVNPWNVEGLTREVFND
jgi:hypothetical protein